MNTTTPPQRKVEIRKLSFTRSDGSAIEPGEAGPEWAVYVDGAYRGACNTREKAERAAEAERVAPEAVEERAIRVLRDAGIDKLERVGFLGMEHTGGGCRAAAIYLTDAEGNFPTEIWEERLGYIWVTSAQDYDASDRYLVGVYTNPDGSEWEDDYSGPVVTDEELVAKVRAGLEMLLP